MKTTFLAAVAVLALTAGAAMAQRAQFAQVLLAAGGGNHPQAETSAHGTQLAASGLDYVRRSHGEA
jgi:hypothetical protein